MWIREKLKKQTYWGQLCLHGAVEKPWLRLEDPGCGILGMNVLLKEFSKHHTDDTKDCALARCESRLPPCVDRVTHPDGVLLIQDGSLLLFDTQNTGQTLPLLLKAGHQDTLDSLKNKQISQRILRVTQTIQTAHKTHLNQPKAENKTTRVSREDRTFLFERESTWNSSDAGFWKMLERKRTQRLPIKTLAWLAGLFDAPQETPMSLMGAGVWQNGDVLPPHVTCEDESLESLLNDALTSLTQHALGPGLKVFVSQTVLEGRGVQTQYLIEDVPIRPESVSSHDKIRWKHWFAQKKGAVSRQHHT